MFAALKELAPPPLPALPDSRMTPPIASSAFFLVIFYVADFSSLFCMPSILFRERTVVSLDWSARPVI